MVGNRGTGGCTHHGRMDLDFGLGLGVSHVVSCILED